MRELSTIKVLLVDDHEVVRDGLRQGLKLEKRIQVIGEAATGEEAIIKAVELSPDVIIMNITMPGLDGIAATRQIKQQMPHVAILMLTLHDEEDFVKRAIEAGASGYLLKDSTWQQLIKAIHDIYKGFNPISPSINRVWAKELLKSSQDRRSSLTERQSDKMNGKHTTD